MLCEGLERGQPEYLSDPIACPGEEASTEEGEGEPIFENGGLAEDRSLKRFGISDPDPLSFDYDLFILCGAVGL